MSAREVDLPRGWRSAPLSDLGTWSGGGTPSKAHSSFWKDGSIPWVSPKDMKVERIQDSEDHITEEAVRGSATKLVPSGSVLFVTRSGILAHTFPVAVTTVDVTVNQDLKAVTPHLGLSPDYVAWGTRAFGGEILRRCSKDGTTVASIDTERLMGFELPVAPLPEQHRIVEAIESYFTRLDDAVATLERVQRNLKRYRASVLKAAVEGRLVPTEAEMARAEGRDYEPASMLLERILAERRRRWEEGSGRGRYQQPVAPDTTDLPELPEGWCWATVDQLTDGARSCSYGVLVPGPDVPDGVPLVRVADINASRVSGDGLKKISRHVANQFKRTFLRGGEVLITLVGTIGRTAVAESTLAGANVARAVGVIPTTHLVDARWIEQWLRSPLTRARLEGKAHEVARKTLNLEDVRAAPVALPPSAEQAQIRARVATLTSLADAASSSVEASSVRAARLRQSILKWAFEGRLADQDPTDEPAAFLLERIKAERKAAGSTKRNGRGTRKTA